MQHERSIDHVPVSAQWIIKRLVFLSIDLVDYEHIYMCQTDSRSQMADVSITTHQSGSPCVNWLEIHRVRAAAAAEQAHRTQRNTSKLASDVFEEKEWSTEWRNLCLLTNNNWWIRAYQTARVWRSKEQFLPTDYRSILSAPLLVDTTWAARNKMNFFWEYDMYVLAQPCSSDYCLPVSIIALCFWTRKGREWMAFGHMWSPLLQ